MSLLASDVLTLREVASALHVSERTARRLVSAGIIRGFRAGPRQWRVRHSVLEAYIDAQQYLAKQRRGEPTVVPSIRDLKGWDRFR